MYIRAFLNALSYAAGRHKQQRESVCMEGGSELGGRANNNSYPLLLLLLPTLSGPGEPPMAPQLSLLRSLRRRRRSLRPTCLRRTSQVRSPVHTVFIPLQWKPLSLALKYRFASVCTFRIRSCCRRPTRPPCDRDPGGAGLVPGPAGDHPDPQVRLGHGIQQGKDRVQISLSNVLSLSLDDLGGCAVTKF